MVIVSYKDLTVWQRSVDLVMEIYGITEKFPSNELYGLTSQMRRAAVSIASNIAEGKARSTRKDYRHFLYNSFGSGAEHGTQVEIAKKLKFRVASDFSKIDALLEEIMKMLNVLIRKLD
jgi:four helix bundle protein